MHAWCMDGCIVYGWTRSSSSSSSSSSSNPNLVLSIRSYGAAAHRYLDASHLLSRSVNVFLFLSSPFPIPCFVQTRHALCSSTWLFFALTYSSSLKHTKQVFAAIPLRLVSGSRELFG
jgi:hypothetical protein